MRNCFFISMKKIIQVDLTDKGLTMITKSGEDPEFFVLPDIGVKLAEIEKSTASCRRKIATERSNAE